MRKNYTDTTFKRDGRNIPPFPSLTVLAWSVALATWLRKDSLRTHWAAPCWPAWQAGFLVEELHASFSFRKKLLFLQKQKLFRKLSCLLACQQCWQLHTLLNLEITATNSHPLYIYIYLEQDCTELVITFKSNPKHLGCTLFSDLLASSHFFPLCV